MFLYYLFIYIHYKKVAKYYYENFYINIYLILSINIIPEIIKYFILYNLF